METTLTDNGAATAVISRSEAKAHCRVYHTEDDAYIDTLILSATQVIEAETRRAFITRAFTLSLTEFPAGILSLPRSPLVSVTSITYKDEAGATQTLSSSAYLAFAINGVGRVQLKGSQTWPSVYAEGGMVVDVNFTAGYSASAASVPVALKHAVMLQAAHMYENRGSVNIGNIVNEIPMTVQRLIVQYHSGEYS
jgi:uncharacterized phiE125 gp8 family phage protein